MSGRKELYDNITVDEKVERGRVALEGIKKIHSSPRSVEYVEEALTALEERVEELEAQLDAGPKKTAIEWLSQKHKEARDAGE